MEMNLPLKIDLCHNCSCIYVVMEHLNSEISSQIDSSTKADWLTSPVFSFFSSSKHFVVPKPRVSRSHLLLLSLFSNRVDFFFIKSSLFSVIFQNVKFLIWGFSTYWEKLETIIYMALKPTCWINMWINL